MTVKNPEKIVLYTNHRCPYARRAHATLKELDLEYEEVHIDLSKPREQWYLDINPRGLVPAIKYGDEIISESGTVSEFLIDAFGPNHLLPAPTSPENAVARARAKWLVETYNTKVQTQVWKLITSPDSELEAASKSFVDAVEKEIEPYLSNAKPFFGGSDKLTWVEVQLGSFLIYPLSFASQEAGWLLNKAQFERLRGLKNFGPWFERVTEHPTIQEFFSKDVTVKTALERRANVLAAKN